MYKAVFMGGKYHCNHRFLVVHAKNKRRFYHVGKF